MARQPRSRPDPVPLPREPFSRAVPPEEWAALHACPAPPADPERVFRDHAADLAGRYGVAAAEAEQGLRRLAETFLGERAGDAAVLDDAIRRPPLTLLADALDVMTGPEAVRLVLTADLADLDRRVRTAAWLGSPDTPLYSREEMGHALAALAVDLQADRESLVKTGLPSRPYRGSPWLYHRLGRLYPTRQAASFVPYAERVSKPHPGVPPHTWVQTPHRDVNAGGDLRPCEYEQADFLPGLPAADGHRIEADRARLLDLKLRFLRRLAQGLADGRVGSLGTDLLALLAGTLTAADFEFYVEHDGRHPPTLDDPATHGAPPSPGGLTDWLEVAGHCEEELAVGTLAAARAALTARTRTLLHDMTRGGSDRNGILPEQLYLVLHGSPEQTAMDVAIDAVVARRPGAKAFWAEYRERVNAAVRRTFRAQVVVPVASAHAGTVGPALLTYAAQAERALDTGQWLAAPPAGLNVFRRDGPTWTVIFDGKLVGRPDAAGLFYLRLLLERPGRDFDARVLSRTRGLWLQDRTGSLDEKLAQAITDTLAASDEPAAVSPGSDLGEVADEKAVAEYEARAAQIAAEMRATSSKTVRGRSKRRRLKRELKKVNSHIRTARALGGRLRRMGVKTKLARDAVVKAIGDAVEGFREGLPALHRHLVAALRLGPTCCYNPVALVNWAL